MSVKKNTFWQLTTTKRGIKMADRLYPNAKYYFKLRSDMLLRNLNERVPIWIEKLKTEHLINDIFNSKLITYQNNHSKKGIRTPWYYTDYFLFAEKEDFKRYYNFKKAYKYMDKDIGSEKTIALSYIWNKKPDTIHFTDDIGLKYFIFDKDNIDVHHTIREKYSL